MTNKNKPLIGWVGQGWIGKNYANEFEERGYEVVRFSLESEFFGNKKRIRDCDIVFIAVPTPSTPTGFDSSIVDNALKLVGKGKIAVIKSTILPGTTSKLQSKYSDIYLMHSPEFLTEATAQADTKCPTRNIIGYTSKSHCKAGEVMIHLPVAPYEKICPVKEAELLKYAGNIWFYWKVIYINMLYDLSYNLGIDYESLKLSLAADKRIGRTHLDAIHKDGRGAGGHCFIKDMSAFAEIYKNKNGSDEIGNNILKLLQEKNKMLLRLSKKDISILNGVYGEED